MAYAVIDNIDVDTNGYKFRVVFGGLSNTYTEYLSGGTYPALFRLYNSDGGSYVLISTDNANQGGDGDSTYGNWVGRSYSSLDMSDFNPYSNLITSQQYFCNVNAASTNWYSQTVQSIPMPEPTIYSPSQTENSITFSKVGIGVFTTLSTFVYLSYDSYSYYWWLVTEIKGWYMYDENRNRFYFNYTTSGNSITFLNLFAGNTYKFKCCSYVYNYYGYSAPGYNPWYFTYTTDLPVSTSNVYVVKNGSWVSAKTYVVKYGSWVEADVHTVKSGAWT